MAPAPPVNPTIVSKVNPDAEANPLLFSPELTMSETALQTQYRQEFIAKFEQGETLLRKTVTTEFEVHGNNAVFLVAGTGGDEAVTRGVNGLIPAVADDLTQLTCALAEWHNLRRKTRFNIFAGQANQRAIMQMNTLKVLNRKIDSDILAQLELGTLDTGAATTASVDLVTYATTILGNNEIPIDGNVFGLITPAFEGFLSQTREFGSAQYTNRMVFDGTNKSGVYTQFLWKGVNWIVHPRLTGRGTSAEKCIMYHRDAIGHAADMDGLDVAIGYDKEQDYSYARASGFFGSKLLQNAGIVIMNHDGSAYAAQ